MDTGKYILRSLRYILRMAVLLGIVFAVMAAAGLLETGGENIFRAVFISRNGLMLLGVLIILAGIYPHLSFGEISLRGDIHADRQKIKEVMEQYGFTLSCQEEHRMVFRASKMSRRIASQFDDPVTVTGHGGRLYIEGMKKDILRLEGRLLAALRDED